MRRPIFAAFVLLCSLMAARQANATTIVFMPLAELVETADFIFHGTVEQVQTTNLASGGLPQIVTDVTFSVTRTLKGTNPGPRFSLRLIGGSWGGYVLKIPGQPTFQKGQEVLLILQDTGNGFALSGMGQGLFHVTRNADGSKSASRTLRGSPVHPFRHSEELLRQEMDLEFALEDLFAFIRAHR